MENGEWRMENGEFLAKAKNSPGLPVANMNILCEKF